MDFALFNFERLSYVFLRFLVLETMHKLFIKVLAGDVESNSVDPKTVSFTIQWSPAERLRAGQASLSSCIPTDL